MSIQLNRNSIVVIVLLFAFTFGKCLANDDIEGDVDGVVDGVTVVPDLGSGREGSRTDDEVVVREEEAIKLDGISVSQLKQLRESAEKFAFQAEVNRMMKLIINSLYRNKEIFLRELISNASDALDKIRLLSLTDSSALDSTPELTIRIKADKDNNMLHITDTGIGMTKRDLINNLGTIAKSGTSEFLQKMGDINEMTEMNDLIGQFGVGFYSAFLVADKVVVTSKNNDDPIQHIWESDSAQFTVVEDPRGDTLKRGSQISLALKEEAKDFLQEDTLKNLIRKYSQFINFKIYLWSSKTETVEEPIDDDSDSNTQDVKSEESVDEEAKVEDEKEEKKAKTRKVEKTIWDWDLINSSKPIWTRKPHEITDEEYNEFYKSITKDSSEPLSKTHFIAEGEVTFKSLLFVPKTQQSDTFNKYGTKTDNIKLYVRRVFITDDFQDIVPNYLNFIRGVVDSDDLPLNVSRETLQQHKLLKVIRKKLSQDSMRDFYLSQKKTLEVNPRHPLIRELSRRIEENKDDTIAKNMALLMYETATLRSGFMLSDTSSFAQRVETLLRKTLGVDESAQVEEEEDDDEDTHTAKASDASESLNAEEEEEKPEYGDHEEL
ncbi:unnamed protein product [Medioppia subpectinata]|uniref:Heat shock protein 83 n=1 Tax=Medioppia subpectinata TaxID=1979941 RepID=A0A7R9KDV0_9ACAR|nr:unnamed protein product [Medioppia subpectinata]CAG2100312.1 unnamed protein product [Medioppia subpectinata]